MNSIARRQFVCGLFAAAYALRSKRTAAGESAAVSIAPRFSAHSARLSPQEVIRRMAAHVLKDSRDRSYETDIRLEALMSLDDATGGHDYLGPAQALLRQRQSRGAGQPEFWREPYASLAFEVFERDGDRANIEHYVAESRRALTQSLRSHDGIVSIYNDDAVRAYPESLEYIRRDWVPVFVDNVQEYAGRMAKTGWLTGDRAFYREAADQLVRLRTALRDPETGLYAHGRGFFGSRDTIMSVNWGRGQAWVLRGLVETLSYLPSASSEASRVSTILHEFGDCLMRYQNSRGFWRQVADRDDSYEETSCTGMIAYYFARAVKQGFLPQRGYARASNRAFSALMQHKVSTEGDVYGGSKRTPPLATMRDYLERDTPLNDPHGVAGAIFAASGNILLKVSAVPRWSPFRANAS